MFTIILLWFLMLYVRVFAQNAPLYTVVAPAKLRPDIVYHVSVTLHESTSAADFSVQIFGTTENQSPVSVLKNVHVEPRQTQVIDFELFSWKPGSYTLEVIGQSGINVRNSTRLIFENKSNSVFIQTDRPVYKPNQLVQFRVIVVNPYLLPQSSQLPISLLIKDGHGNSIQEWNNVYTSRGVASADFRLADRPVLGDWSVHVDVEGQKFQKNFTVAELIIPTYEVEIELPVYVTYNRSDVEVTLKAMHSYGEPVRGEVTLTVAPRTRYNKLNVRPYESFQTKAPIDGSVHIYLNLLRDLSLRTDFFKREIEFFALVEEEETGHKYNATNTLWIYDKNIKIDLIRTSNTFKPGLLYTAFLKISHQDDSPVSDGRDNLELTYGYNPIENTWKTEVHSVPRNSIVKLEFYPPREETTLFLSMRAVFRGQTFYLDQTDAAVSPSDNFLQVRLLTPNPRSGETIEMEVNATENMDYLVYKVFGRGNLLLAKTIPAGNQKEYRFNFRAPSTMAPRSRVLVYYVRSLNGEIVADSVSFDVEGLFKTAVTVNPSSRETQPGRQVDIRLQTTPGAMVGILGLDLGIQKLKSGNDLSQEEIINELESYDGGLSMTVRPPWYRRRRKRSLAWTGSKSAGLVFQDSGSVIMTNALLLNTGNEGLFTENVIRLDENSNNAPFQPPSELPEAVVSDERLVIRKKYPETWLWVNTTVGADGLSSISHVVPNAIASYSLTAFAVHPSEGLGIASASTQVTVSRPFYITMSLPYTVLKGEDLAIQVVVFNYNSKSIQAEVVMENRKGEFDFTSASQSIVDQTRRTRIVNVPPYDGVAVSFLIIPQKVGFIEIKVSAATSLAGDTLTKQLLVQPEGSTQYFNEAFYVDISGSGSSVKRNISTVIPKNAIPDSGKIVVSATVDLMATSINSVNKLIHLPTGCGEQNLLTIVPGVITLDYLSQNNRLTSERRNQIIVALRNGYQRQLTYKRNDGSFSTFGERDRSGSTWLTAYTIKSLTLAQRYIYVDPNVLNRGLEWIIQKQNSDGSFEEPGEVHHKALQSGSGNEVALTAFVLAALRELRAQDRYGQQMVLAQRYVERELQSLTSPYDLSIATFALHLVDSSSKDRAFQMLLNVAQNTGDYTFWSEDLTPVNKTYKQSDYWFVAPSIDLETVAYAVRACALRGDVRTAMPAVRWIVTQQNANGGFSATQDTVVALHALSEIAPFVTPSVTNLNVKFTYSDSQRALQVSSSRPLSVDEIQIPPNTPFIEIEVSGMGSGVVSVSRQFNLAVSGEAPEFFLNALLDKTSTASYLQLSICTHELNRNHTTNMAVMEVSLPSGYVADVDALPSVLQIEKVKRVETHAQETRVAIYLDRLDRTESCITVPAHRVHKVARQRRAFVHVYDFYNKAKSARMFYRPHRTVLCDICDGDDCGESCSKPSQTTSDESSSLVNDVAKLQSFLPLLFSAIWIALLY